MMPRFLFAENLSGRKTFIIHTREPFFIARYFDMGHPADEIDLAISFAKDSDFRFSLKKIGEGWLQDFVWSGKPPEGEELFKLLRAAENFLMRYDERLGIK